MHKTVDRGPSMEKDPHPAPSTLVAVNALQEQGRLHVLAELQGTHSPNKESLR